MKRVLRFFRRPAKILALCVGAFLAGGVVYALVENKGMEKSVAYAFFIGGVVIVIFGSMAGGGARGQRIDGYSGGAAAPQEMPFGTILIGAIVFALGLAVLKL
ncbi:MAG TPA: hypothetical protein VH063_00500 [Gaiellaceae bacterium]|jgi:hypothetical protein|nr:hypothetical protein [Gaiellaceae bacterium]